MGGSASRPRNGVRKTEKYGSGVFIQLRSNLLYQKFLKKSNRSAPPPCRPAAPPPRKITFYFFFFSPPVFSLKEKGNFLLGSVLTNRTAGLRGRLAGKKFPPSCPLHFLPAR